ncbi:MAG TPA: DNA alkylation repair protein [Anaerolineaceae bacterium]|nr:DNA alkylation repair protein [Anaerolineaceae bacterium]
MPPPPLTLETALAELHRQSDPARRAGMARYGIDTSRALGVPMPAIRSLARGQRSHALALELWASGIHEARILASLVDDPRQVTREQMEAWVADFNSWDVCDQVCGNLFDRTPYAVDCVFAWSQRQPEFEKRAAYALIAWLAVHDKKAPDSLFLSFLPVVEQGATDPRNFVKKAVNWALRQTGKRNAALRTAALQAAHRIRAIDSPAARWVAADAIRELEAKGRSTPV